ERDDRQRASDHRSDDEDAYDADRAGPPAEGGEQLHVARAHEPPLELPNQKGGADGGAERGAQSAARTADDQRVDESSRGDRSDDPVRDLPFTYVPNHHRDERGTQRDEHESVRRRHLHDTPLPPASRSPPGSMRKDCVETPSSMEQLAAAREHAA